MSELKSRHGEPPPPFLGWKWRVRWGSSEHLLVALLDDGESEFVVTERTVDISSCTTESRLLQSVHAAMNGMRTEVLSSRDKLAWVNKHWGI